MKTVCQGKLFRPSDAVKVDVLLDYCQINELPTRIGGRKCQHLPTSLLSMTQQMKLLLVLRHQQQQQKRKNESSKILTKGHQDGQVLMEA